MNPYNKSITVAGKNITVTEMTVNNARDWLMQSIIPEDVEVDVVQEMLLDDISIRDIIKMSSISEAEAGKMRPSDLKAIAAVCKEMNPDFFMLRNQVEISLVPEELH